MTEEKQTLIVMDGSISEGFTAYGPFSTYEEAQQFKALCDDGAVILKVQDPEDAP